jgi:hypothetical protein
MTLTDCFVPFQSMQLGVINAPHRPIRRASTSVVLTFDSTEQKTSPSSATAMSHTCLDRSAWRLSSKAPRDSSVSSWMENLEKQSNFMNANLSRGWSLATSHSSLRFCGRHWCHGRLQLGSLREWRVLGGVLLCRRFMQHIQQSRTVGDIINQHSATHGHHEAAAVVERVDEIKSHN